MPLNEIQPSTNFTQDTSADFPITITTLSSANYVLTYQDYAGGATGVVHWAEFTPTGQLVAGAPVISGINDGNSVVTALSGGGFVLAWESMPFGGVYYAVYDAQGNQTVSPFLTGNSLDSSPILTTLANDTFALSWLRSSASGKTDIFSAIYNAQGDQISAPVDVSSTPNSDDRPVTTVLANGNYALTWSAGISDTNTDIFTAIFTAQGVQVSAAVDLSIANLTNESSVQATALVNGGYAVTWIRVAPGGGGEVVIAAYDALGHEVVAPEVVGAGIGSQVAALANGNVALFWSNGDDVFTAVYDAQGHQLSTPVNLSNSSGKVDNAWQVTALSNGAYAVTWDGPVADNSYDVFTAVFDAQGQQVGATVNVSHLPSVNDIIPAVTALANGAYVVAWGSQTPFVNDVYTAVYQFVDSSQPSGDVTVVGTSDIAIDLGAVINVGGSVTVTDNGAAAVINLGNLVSVSGNFVLSDNGAVLSIALPNLTSVGGNITVSGNTSATAIGFGSLATVGGGVSISTGTGTTINMGSPSATGDISLSAGTGTTINMGSPSAIGDISLSAGTGTTINMGSPSATGDISLTAGTGTTINMGSPSATGNISLSAGTGTAINMGSPSVTGNISVSTGDTTSVVIGSGASAGSLFVTTGASSTVGVGNNTVVGNLSVSTGDTTSVVVGSGTSAADFSVTTGGGSTVNVGSGTSAADFSVTTGDSSTVDVGNPTVAGSLIVTTGGGTTVNVGSGTSAADFSVTTGDGSTVDVGSPTVAGDLAVNAAPEATAVDASGLGPGGGTVVLTGGSNGNTTITFGDTTNVGGTVTVAGAGGVTVTATAGVAGITITGTAGNDTATGSATATNTMDGGGGNDTLTGGNAADTITGGDGNDVVAAGAGNDTVVGGHGGGDDVYDGGPGIDVVTYTSATHAITVDLTETDRSAQPTLGGATIGQLLTDAGKAATTPAGFAQGVDIGTDALIGIENVVGGQAGDTITGNALDNVIAGGAGNDTLDGQAGNDTAVFSGNRGDYAIGQNADGSLTVADTRATSPDGVDTVRHFELFKFANATNTLAELLPPPVITSNGGGDNATVSIAENTTAVTNVTSTDPNAAQTLAFSIAGGADAAKFQIDVVTGALSFIAAPNFEAPTDAGTNNVYDVIVQVSDGFNFDTQALAVTVTNANEAPVVAALSATVSENGSAFIQDLLAGAGDPDFGDQLSVAGLDATVTTAGGRTLALGTDYTLGNGTIALTAVGFAKFDDLSAAQSDQFVFHFGVSDGSLSTPNTLAVTMNGANDAPVLLNQTPNQTATAGTPYSFTLPANTFQDVDNGDHLTLAATQGDNTALPAWLSFDATSSTFSGTPGTADAGSFDIKLTAADTGQLAAFETFHITVAGASANRPPVIISDGGGDTASVIITDDSRYVATVHASDPDPQPTIKYSIVGGADAKLFSIDPVTGLLSFKTEPREGHSYQVAVAASDGSLQDSQTIKVQVANGPFAFGNAGVADTFVLKPHFGLEIVDRFDAASPQHDVLELDHALFRNANANASPAETFNFIHSHSFQFGPDVVIVTDTHDIIDLRNTDLHKLTAGDFLLT